MLGEAVTLTRFAHSHAKAVKLANAVMASKFMRIVYPDKRLFADAVQTFKSHFDKELRLSECLSLATMRKHEIKTAFTLDPRFKQAGLTTVL